MNLSYWWNRQLTNLNDAILQGEDRQKSKASAPGRACFNKRSVASLRSACFHRLRHFVINLEIGYWRDKLLVVEQKTARHKHGPLIGCGQLQCQNTDDSDHT